MTEVKIILKAMPERARYIREIKDQIPGLTIVFDQIRNAMDTFVRGLEAAGTSPALYLEDDIELCDGFLEKVQQVLTEHGDVPVQFFSRFKDDPVRGSRWMPGSSFSMNQCHYLPVGMSLSLLEYQRSGRWPRAEEHPTGYDLMMADFFKERGLQYWLHVPSLVQHREGRSLIGASRARARQSGTFTRSDGN